MKVNFKRVFLDNYGCPIMEKKDGQDVPQEIGRFLAVKLFNLSMLGGNPLPPEKKYMAYVLSKRMSVCPEEVECTTEEASFLKEVCGELLSSGAYGQVVDLIENKV